MNVMNVDYIRELRNKVHQAEEDLKKAKLHLKEVEDCCLHRWEEPTFSPIMQKGYPTIGSLLSVTSSDPSNPLDLVKRYQDLPDVLVDRWTRICTLCEKREYTQKYEAKTEVSKIPTF